MQDFVVKRDSWHFRVMSKFYGWHSYNRYEQPRDFCTYWRKFAWMSLMFAVLGALAGTVLSLLVHGAITSPGPFFAGLAMIVGMIVVVLTVVFGGAVAIEKIKDYRDNSPVKEPGLIETKYRSFKDQYCPMVRYED